MTILRLYAPAVVLLGLAVWLAVVGDGGVFGPVAFVLLAFAVVVQVRTTRCQQRGRKHG